MPSTGPRPKLVGQEPTPGSAVPSTSSCGVWPPAAAAGARTDATASAESRVPRIAWLMTQPSAVFDPAPPTARRVP